LKFPKAISEFRIQRISTDKHDGSFQLAVGPHRSSIGSYVSLFLVRLGQSIDKCWIESLFLLCAIPSRIIVSQTSLRLGCLCYVLTLHQRDSSRRKCYIIFSTSRSNCRRAVLKSFNRQRALRAVHTSPQG